MMEQAQAIILFKEQKIRRTWYEEQWFFSVVGVLQALTDSVDGRKYWNKLKQRLNEEESETVTFCHQLKLPAPDGKMRITDCAVAKRGGNVAGAARKQTEAELGHTIVSDENYLALGAPAKKLVKMKGKSDA